MKQVKLTKYRMVAATGLSLGHDTSKTLGAYIGIEKWAAYQRILTLVEIGIAKKAEVKGHYVLIHENYVLGGDEKVIPEDNPSITESQAKILDAVKLGLNSTKKILTHVGLSFGRGTITHGLTDMFRQGLVTRKESENGTARTVGYRYEYSGRSYTVGRKKRGSDQTPKFVSYEACDLLSFGAVA